MTNKEIKQYKEEIQKVLSNEGNDLKLLVL